MKSIVIWKNEFVAVVLHGLFHKGGEDLGCDLTLAIEHISPPSITTRRFLEEDALNYDEVFNARRAKKLGIDIEVPNLRYPEPETSFEAFVAQARGKDRETYYDENLGDWRRPQDIRRIVRIEDESVQEAVAVFKGMGIMPWTEQEEKNRAWSSIPDFVKQTCDILNFALERYSKMLLDEVNRRAQEEEREKIRAALNL